MSENFVVFARPGIKNFIFPLKQVENKTVNELIDTLLQRTPISFNKNDEIIMVKTSLYREAIQSSCDPIKTFPNLILTEKPNIYQRPPTYLLICAKTEENVKFFYLNAIVQEDIDLPAWEVGLNSNDFKNKSSEALCKYLIEKFPYETDKSLPISIINDSDQNLPTSMTASQMLNEMCEKKYSIKCALSENELKKVRYRSQIVTEIQKSEEIYISQLTIIKDVIIPQFKKNKILLDEDYRKFNIISNMIIIHSQFLNDLKSAGTSFSANLSTIFLNFCDFFKIVKPYIKSLGSIYEMMSRVDKGKIDQIVKNEPRLNNVVPMSYFIVPFQRIPKYPLFLRDLINNTPKCHPDSNFLNLALESIKKVLDDIEYSKESAEEQQKLYEIFMRTSKKVNLLDPRRRLVEQITAKLRSNGWKAIFYIFNDMILLTAMKKNEEVIVHHSTIENFYYLIQTTELTISFHLNDNNNSNCVVEFENAADKEKFIDLVEKSRAEKYKEIDQSQVFSISRVSDPNIDQIAIQIYSHTTTALNNTNTVFTFGGNGYKGGYTNISSFFDPTSNTFKVFTAQDGPSARSEHALCASDDGTRVFLFGGRSGSDYFNDLYVGTIKGGSEVEWKKIVSESSENDPESRAGHSMVYNNEELIVFGGYLKSEAFNDTFIFSLKENKWSKLKSDVMNMPSPRSYHSACKAAGWMIVHGGRNPQQALNDTSFFDLNDKKWLTFKITGETPCRYGHQSVYANGYIVFVGGVDEKKEIVQPTAINTLKDKEWFYEEFKMIGNQPSSLSLFGLAAFNSSQFFIYGGVDPLTIENVSNSIYVVKTPAAIQNESKKTPVPQIIEPTVVPTSRSETSKARKNTLSFFNFLKGKKSEKSTDEIPELSKEAATTPPPPATATAAATTPSNDKDINYDMILGQINIDPTKLLPFQKKQLEKYLRDYHSILMNNNQILMSISDMFFKMKKKINIPAQDIFVKLYDKLDSNIFIIKISTTTSFEQFLAILTEKMKNRSEYSVTIMKYYPFTPDFYDFNIYYVIKNNISHLSVLVS